MECYQRTLLKTETPCIRYGEQRAYCYFVLETGILHFLNVNNISVKCDDLFIDINIYGLPLTKSSNSQFWPVLGCVNNYLPQDPFVIGVYHSFNKPKHPKEILSDFISEYNYLQSTGINYKGKTLRVTI